MRNPKLLFELCKGKNIFIQTHNFPDPDAIASAYGLQRLLKLHDIDSTICHVGRIDKLSAKKMLDLCSIEMYATEDLKTSMTENDMIILVDCQKGNGNTADLIGQEFAVIDHHPTFTDVEYDYSDIEYVGSCASIIMSYYKALNIEPDKDVATALLYGLKTDTLQFQRGVTDFDIDMFRFIFPYISQSRLIKLERDNMEFEDLRAYATAIEHTTVFDKIGFTYIDYPCPDAMLGILSDFILSLTEVDVSIIDSVREDGLKFSIRSERKDIDAGKLANEILGKYGSGGGHPSMAGGFIPSERIGEIGSHPYETLRAAFLDSCLELQKNK